jgi:1,4-alpha-glucan branching enzyme
MPPRKKQPTTDATEQAVLAVEATSPKKSAAERATPPAGSTELPPIVAHDLDALVGGAHAAPHDLLGARLVDGGVLVRALRPDAHGVEVVVDGESIAMERQSEAGLFALLLEREQVPDYRLRVTYEAGTFETDDPYRYLPTLGEVDLHLIGEGRHERLWDVLGAHVRHYDTPTGGVTGTSFAVWAPSARGVRVLGDFNFWDGRPFPMRSLGSSGVWELFVPGVGAGALYKLQILGADGTWREKADPMAFGAQVPPETASVVVDSSYEWDDAAWLSRRAQTEQHAAPMSVYEVHLGSWRQGLSYRELAHELVDYVSSAGFTHVEFLPVAAHPFSGSWGYQVTSYYAPTPRFGSPDDLRYLIDALHRADIGVIVDWVPAHFPKDEWALARFDGTPLYEHPDPRRGEQPDWGTLVFDFGRAEVRNFLVANALYWLEEYHVDGLRVDAVASMLYLDYSRKDGEWLPNKFGGRENLEAVDFLKEMNATVYKNHPGAVTIAEESTAWPAVSRPTHLGGLGFGFKWNMGWMHDTLDYAAREPVYRGYHHHQMTFSMMYAYSENFVLPLSHDEVVYGKGSLLRKMPGDRWQQLAGLRSLLAFQWTHPGKQLLFMGGEFGQDAEWDHDSSLQWELLGDPGHAGVHRLVTDLNATYKATSALWSQDTEGAGFSWIDANDASNNTFSFLRWGSDSSCAAVVVNFAGKPHEGYRLGLPFAGTWREAINTDAEAYGGSGVGNLGAVQADEHGFHGQPAAATLRVPPLGALILTYEG